MLRAGDAAIVPDRDYSREISEAEAGRRIREALARLPRVLTEDGLLYKVAIDSELVWVWDEGQVLTFSEQVFRHMYSQPIVETLLDRPLRGAPYIEQMMYGRHGLAEMATKDLTNRGGCVVAQIVELATKRKKVTSTSGGRTTLSGDQKGATDTRTRKDTRSKVRVRRFTPEDVEAHFDRIFKRMYPGEAVNEEACLAGEVEPQIGRAS